MRGDSGREENGQKEGNIEIMRMYKEDGMFVYVCVCVCVCTGL